MGEEFSVRVDLRVWKIEGEWMVGLDLPGDLTHWLSAEDAEELAAMVATVLAGTEEESQVEVDAGGVAVTFTPTAARAFVFALRNRAALVRWRSRRE